MRNTTWFSLAVAVVCLGVVGSSNLDFMSSHARMSLSGWEVLWTPRETKSTGDK